MRISQSDWAVDLKGSPKITAGRTTNRRRVCIVDSYCFMPEEKRLSVQVASGLLKVGSGSQKKVRSSVI